ncbi:hypothetical protein FOA52_013145 [Chlamydomonas sp. UWO 241]|nr:hypothetical protein FOA52_013145 [Chlamydomonas sp. UWO 241]
MAAFAKADKDSATIAKKLGIFALVFYVVYYILSIIMVGAFKVSWSGLGKFPFRESILEFNPAGDGGALGAWLAMVLTYLCCLALAFFVVKQTKRTWDYVMTTTLLHFVITCLVNLAFPTNWICTERPRWPLQLALEGGTIRAVSASLCSEFVIYYLIDIQMDH